MKCVNSVLGDVNLWNNLGFSLCAVLLQSQDLRVDQEKEPCIEFTQGNSIENSVQDCLPFIPKLHGPC